MTDLQKRLCDAISNADFDWNPSNFSAFAVEIFAHQFQHNRAYRKFCEGRGVRAIEHWREIPAVPTDAFKFVDFSTTSKPEAVFQTSGTTQGQRGRHAFASLDVYRAAVAGPFRRFCQSETRLTMLALTPSPGDLPDSSLSFMFGELLTKFGRPWTSGFFIAREGDDFDFDFDGLVDALDGAQGPVFLLGTAFAFVEFFDAVDLRWRLPAGSRVLETGGLKGRTREVSKAELYRLFEERLGIAPSHMLSEYSMTELSSQAYTDNRSRGVSWEEARFVAPPWTRVEVVDPHTLELIEAPQARGLIRWYDLANLHSVIAVQTSDIGTRFEDGAFVLEGRAQDAELRGCSLTIEEIRRA